MEPLKVNYGVVADLETVYPNMNYEAEVNVTNRIVELLKSDPYQFGEVKVYDEKATPDQREAVAYALNNWITIINGDAGSGKSTTIKEIILNLEERKIPYECGSFTGKACSRLRSILGKNHPKTLDRLISQGSGTDFEWYIADEVSMFALLLMHRFFKKFTHKFHLIIVADQKQLLPIGVGNFYIQLLIAGIIPTRTLTQNHRIMNSNGEINKIITNSLGLFNTPDGEYFEFQTGPEFQLYHNDSMEPVSNILKMLKDLKVEAKDIQIITYYTKHIPKLNKAFQEIYKTSDEFCIDSKGRVILKGDRVFHNKNDPENNLANGDIGIVTYVSTDKIKVHFEAYDYTETFTTAIMTDPMDYKERDVSNLDIGFACSIDKFQGSEAKYIILYCPSDPVNKSFLNYNRLYTTFTRARVAFFAVGNINELLVGARTSPKFVHEKLAQRIRLAMKLPAVAEVVIEEDYNYD